MKAILTRLKTSYDEGRLLRAAAVRSRPLRLGLLHLLHNPAGRRIAIHAPDHLEPGDDPAERALVERIFAAFRRMKEDQRRASDLYLPSSRWQERLERGYFSLTEGLRANDLGRFHYFLANFGSWDAYHGVEASQFLRHHARHLRGRRYLANAVLLPQLRAWEWFTNHARPVSALSYPTHGNQGGAYIDGVFVGLKSVLNDVYGTMLSGLLSGMERPVVADLGAGYGKLAYFTLRDVPRSCFVDFDLPETLCLAAYYLMKTWPDKRALLYGEREYSSAVHDDYDLVFMPASEIARLGDGTIDLFINRHSLGEMTAAAAANYVGHITRTTRFFFHMNHELVRNAYEGGGRGLLAGEYPVPPDQFRLLVRAADIWHMIYQAGGFDYGMDVFLYLYERK